MFSLFAVAGVAMTVLVGCSTASTSVVATSGATADWPSESLEGIVSEPTFAVKPSAVYDYGNYVMVSYTDCAKEDLLAYVDELEANPDFYVMYDERDPVVSCCVSDRKGNSVTVSQVDGMTETSHKMASISVVKA